MATDPAPRSAFDDPDLRRRVFYTLGALTVFRVGTFLPAPGVDAAALKALVDSRPGGPLGILNAFSGGALGRFSLFSLGVIPFVNASLVAGLLPGGRKGAGRGETARRLTLLFALLQSFGLAFLLARSAAPGGAPLVVRPDWGFYASSVLTLTAGALSVMWLCEEITLSGLGGGALLVVFAGLVANFSGGVANAFRLLLPEEVGLPLALAVLAALLAALMAAVWIETAQRKLTVHYTQRMVGRRMYGGSSSVLPLKLDQSGVVAAVRAAVLVASLSALALAAGGRLASLGRGSWLDDAACAALIVYFCSFAGERPTDPNELADNLKKSGGSLPGIRPGDSTARHFQWINERLAFDGALLVAALAVLPDLLRRLLRLPFFFDGLRLVVIVGVALDAMGRVEAHGLRRAYAKYLK